MRIEVPWSTTTTPVEVDDRRVAGVRSANVGKADDPAGILRVAVSAPSAAFKTFLAGAVSPLLVVVNDATRPTPTAEVLRVLRPDLEAWLAAGDSKLDFIVATGTHRVALPEELDHIFGKELVAAHASRIHSHDAKAKDELVNMGRTARGTEILVNRLLAEAGSVVVINSVEPHYFAGYTGGRKSLFPGIAGYETVWANHKLSMQPGSELLLLEGNPVHEDLMEQLAVGIAGKQVYSIQLVLDEDHHIGFAAAGDLEATWRQAIAVADRQFVLEIERPYEVVVAVAPHPMDCNFYQTNKAIQSGALALAPEGVLIVVSECPFGLGENQTLFDMLSASESPGHALARINVEEYELGVQQAARIAAILERGEIWAVTSLRDEDVRAMFMTPYRSVQEAVDAALAKQGDHAEVLFMMEASITVPRVRSAVG
jgi:nickel-dependent lactate racemase